MPEPQTPPAAHPQFDSLCAEVGDYEPLPEATPIAVLASDEVAESIDEVILAGLVSP